VAVATALLLVLASPGSAAANWRSSLNSSLNNVAEWLGLKQAKPGSLEGAIIALKSLTVPVNGAELVAAGSQEGHWTFVNKRGEKFTAASADELNRVVATLTPEIAAASGAEARLTLLLTEASVFEHRARLKDLPKGADLRLVVDGSVLPLRVRGDLSRTDQAAALYAEIRPNLLVAVVNRVQFDEAVWQLNRPLKHAHVRVLALEPGGPPTITSAPKLDAATRRPLVDRLDPLRAADGIKALRGQTAIIVGRVEGKLLFVRGSSGPEQSVIVSDLVQAAVAADVNLLLLQSGSARQPGARNWFWQAAEVAGLDSALARAQLSDLLAVLGTGERPLTITPTVPEAIGGDQVPGGPAAALGRVTLAAIPDFAPGLLDSVLPGRATEVIGGAVTGAIDEMMSGLTGRVVITAAKLHLLSRDRATELQGRLLPSVPTGWIEGYVGALLLGLLSWRRTSRWWQRLWPQERRGDYAGGFGFQSARAARGLVMLTLFTPLAGLAALPALLLSWLKPARTAKPAPAHSGADR
jgi:hypothetical protein